MEDGELFFFFFLLNEESLFLYQYFNSHLLFGVWTHVLGVYLYIYIYIYIFMNLLVRAQTDLQPWNVQIVAQ